MNIPIGHATDRRHTVRKTPNTNPLSPSHTHTTTQTHRIQRARQPGVEDHVARVRAHNLRRGPLHARVPATTRSGNSSILVREIAAKHDGVMRKHTVRMPVSSCSKNTHAHTQNIQVLHSSQSHTLSPFSLSLLSLSLLTGCPVPCRCPPSRTVDAGPARRTRHERLALWKVQLCVQVREWRVYERERERERERETETERDGRLTQRHTDRQTDTQAGRQADRQTDAPAGMMRTPYVPSSAPSPCRPTTRRVSEKTDRSPSHGCGPPANTTFCADGTGRQTRRADRWADRHIRTHTHTNKQSCTQRYGHNGGHA